MELVSVQKPTWETVIEYLKSTRCGQLTRDVEEFVKKQVKKDQGKGYKHTVLRDILKPLI